MKPLSFVIITYNRPADMLALARNICSLEAASELLEEVIILNNASSANYDGVKKFVQDHPEIPFRYIVSEENLGVAKGRNYAIQKGKAPVIILLDDDAELENPDCLLKLNELFLERVENRPIAIVSFKVLYFTTREMQVNAFPHKRFNEFKNLHSFPTYYYAGGAHAITREAIEKAGSYPEDFFYGMEEYDLAYRLLQSGYAIVYSDQVVMLHKESPEGRQPPKEKLRMMWVNKTKVAWRYLPLRYYYSTSLLWALEYLKKTGGDLKGFTKGWRAIRRIPGTEKRTPVDSDTLQYLEKVRARLSY